MDKTTIEPKYGMPVVWLISTSKAAAFLSQPKSFAPCIPFIAGGIGAVGVAVGVAVADATSEMSIIDSVDSEAPFDFGAFR